MKNNMHITSTWIEVHVNLLNFVVKILRQIQIQNHHVQFVDVSLVDVFQNYQMLHLKIVNLVIYTVTEHQCFILSRRVAREWEFGQSYPEPHT